MENLILNPILKFLIFLFKQTLLGAAIDLSKSIINKLLN